jgi:hypothetical protein
MIVMTKCMHVRGVVVEEGESPAVGQPNLLVVLGRVARAGFVPIAEKVTDATGGFWFDLTGINGATVGTLGLRVYRGRDGEELPAHGTTRWDAQEHPGPLVVCVEYPVDCAVPPESIPQEMPGGNNRVWGRVRHADGTPAGGLEVQLVEVTLTAAVDDVVVTTSSTGWYSLAPTHPGTNFQLRVRVPGTPPELLATSRAVYAPVLPVRVDIEICDDRYRQPSEFARINAAVTPTLTATSTLARNVTVRGVAMLSGLTGWDVERLGHFVVAHKLAFRLAASAELLYGLLRLGWPAAPHVLLGRAPSAVEAAVERASARNYVGLVSASTMATFLVALVAAHKAELGASTARSLAGILTASGVLTSGQATTFIDRWVDRSSEADFWSALPTAPGFNTASATEARRMMTLGIVALMYVPGVQSILVDLGSNAASKLAEYTDTQWSTITSSARMPSIPNGLPGASDSERRAALAELMREHVDDLFGNERARFKIIGAIPTDVGAIFLANPANAAFDLGSSRVADFTGTDDEKEGASVLQRLYLVAPRSRRAETLLSLHAAGFGSAHAITRVGRRRFLAQMEGTLDAATAGQVFARALRRHAATVHGFVQFHPRFASHGLQFIPQE